MKYLIGLFLFICASDIQSQTKTLEADHRITLQQAIRLSSDSSLAAFKARNLYLSCYWQYRTYQAGRLPGVSLNMTPLSYSNNFVKRYDYANNRDVYKSQKSLYSDANLSVNQNVDWTGGTFYIDTDLGYLKNLGDEGYQQFNSVPFRIGYSQSLFGYNSFKWQKKIEPLKYEKAKKQLLYNLEEISEQTAGAFFRVALDETLCHLAKQNIANSDSLYRVGQERCKIGSISPSDLLSLKLNVINAQTALGNAELSLQKSRFSLMALLHIDNEADFSVEIPANIPDVMVNQAEAIRLAMENNPTYLEQQENILLSQQTLDQAVKSNRFSASLSASVGYNQVANQFADVYKDPRRQDIVSVGLSVPLLDWGVRKGKVNIARRDLEAARITARQTEQTFGQEVITAVREFQLRQSQIALAGEARQIAAQALEKAKQLFYVGKADVNTVNSSISHQIEAESNYISALSSYWQGYYKLRKLTLYDFEAGRALTTSFEEINGF